MFRTILLVFLLLKLSESESVGEKKPKYVIDNDAGGDDAMAIFLALLYEKHYDGPELIALTTGNGNTNEDNVCINNQKVLKVARRQDVPIYRGSKESLVVTPSIDNWFGVDGLGDNDISNTDLVPAKEESAVQTLIELSKIYKEDLTIITIGTLTNVALAQKMDPGFLDRVNHLYIGAGHIHHEHLPDTKDPEFNAKMDVEAYHVVMKHASPKKVTLIPYSQVQQSLNFTREWRETVLGAIDTNIMLAQNQFESVSLNHSDYWHALDPAVLGIFLKPDLVEEYRYAQNDIVLCGDKRGVNTNTFVQNKEDANVRVVYSIKAEEYQQFIFDVFSHHA